MTPEAQSMYSEAVNLSDCIKDHDYASKAIVSISGKLKEIGCLISELLINDDSLFDMIFNIAYSKEASYAVMSNFLDIKPDQIDLSTDSDSIVSFTQKSMLHQAMADIFAVARYSCDITRKDFCLAWLLLHEDGHLGTMIRDFPKHHHKLNAKMQVLMSDAKVDSLNKFLSDALEESLKLEDPIGIKGDDCGSEH